MASDRTLWWPRWARRVKGMMSEQVRLSNWVRQHFGSLEKRDVQLCGAVVELEAEVEQLREERDFARQAYDLWRDQAKEYACSRDDYRAAMKDVMDRICIMGLADEDEQWFWDRLDKLLPE